MEGLAGRGTGAKESSPAMLANCGSIKEHSQSF